MDRTRESCWSEVTFRVAVMAAMPSEATPIEAATMFTLCSATTFVISFNSPGRSMASMRTVIG